MAINLKKLLPGGLVAGVVLIVLNVLAQLLLGNRIQLLSFVIAVWTGARMYSEEFTASK